MSIVAFVDDHGTRPAAGAADVVGAGTTMVVAGERDGIARLHAMVSGTGVTGSA